MDGSQFDTLLRGLTRARSRRGAMVGVLGSALGLLGVTESQAKHHKRKHKKKHGGSPPASPPSLLCVPEPQTTTCGGNCATKANNCGQIVPCPCLGTQQCLSNGSCAITCQGPANCPAS